MTRDFERLQAEALRLMGSLGEAACKASGPEAALRVITSFLPTLLGDRDATSKPGALKPGERQFFVSGNFMVSPDGRENWLIAETGFPPEQHRLRIAIDLAHPGWVVANRRRLIIANTDTNTEFKQILKTARMGSAMFAPMFRGERLIGQLICAAQARDTFAEGDLDILAAFAPLAASLYVAHGGEAWLRTLA
ncbi:MAG: GAF domain-containing protein [Alphaproteobacteria bacterium]|nr:GAF domain-containing protein [Alphaproteobacteria bacterium]